MRVTLAPTLSEIEKIALRLWLTQTLESENLCNERTFPISPRRLVVYIDDTSVALLQGTWEKNSSEIYLGRENPYNRENPPLRDCLSILLTLTQLCEPSAELTKACSEAITRYLLGEYRSVSDQLVSATVPVSGLAFCSDNRVASLLGSEWLLPSGEVVDVSGPGWTVCASEVPTAVREPVVDTQFDAGSFGPAFPPVENEPPPIDGDFQFQVGQRVYWNDPDLEDPRSGEGTVRRLPEGSEPYVEVHLDNGANDAITLAYPTELRALGVEFQVGQRVHWDGRDFGQHDGEVIHTPTESVPYYRVLDSEGREWAARLEELSAL